jgi:2-dehydro-3-deoxyphosphogluconate aldolase/(4S)-4-hydroxy-2-oxoglutarate aldolase
MKIPIDMMDVQDFKTLPLLGILRGVSLSDVPALADAALGGGLRAVEITMNTSDAPRLIKKMRECSGSDMSVGAGTVLSLQDLKQALEAGAQFVVMPIIEPSIIEYCRDFRVPVFPGALTPNEIYRAWSLGATMVKVFPANVYGPSYFADVKAPLGHIELLACGGVTVDTIGHYFRNGASAAAFGASVFKKEWIEQKKFDSIKNEIFNLVSAYNNYKKV